MALQLPCRVRRASLLGIATLAASVGALCPVSAASAHKARLESAVSEASVTKPLGETSGEAPAGEAPSGEASTGESSTSTPREERRTRRQARRARRNDSAGAVCSVVLEAKPAVIAAGAPLGLSGTLSCPATTSAAAQTVTLYQRLARTQGFNATATATTEADGTFAFAPAAIEEDSSFYAIAAGAQSASLRVAVAPQVTLSSPAAGTQLPAGSARAARAGAESTSAVTFTGTVSPANAGTTVSLQREVRNEEWARIGGGPVNEEGKFSIAHTFLKPGEANIRVVVHSHGLAMRAISPPVSYLIARRRHSKVTISASANPLAFGQSLTITGTVAGAADQTLTLLAQTGDGAFTPLAQGTANGNEYSFGTSPLQSTRYRVRTVNASSPVLAESLTYALTAEPSTATVPAGAQLSITGTLAPFHEGQSVELERLASPPSNYSVIAVAGVTSPAGYSISYAFPTVGSETLRVKASGDTELQSATSADFNVEVTPAA